MRIEQPGIPSRRPVRAVDRKRLDQMMEEVREDARLRAKTSELLERVVDLLSEMARNDRAVLEKLEEIRYALADNETGVGNLLRQMKLSNRKLEELIDKRK